MDGARRARGERSRRISVFDGVEKQLGLKLTLQNIPLESFVVERVNRKATPNPAGIEAALALAAARFEAANIKPADPNARPFVGLLYTGGSQMRAGGTLRQLIAMALQVTPNIADDMVVGLPKSSDTQKWDITAKVPSSGEGAPNIVRGRPLPHADEATRVRDEGRALLDAADQAISRALSRNSSQFLAQGRQAGGQ
jgi:hypothetical protein